MSKTQEALRLALEALEFYEQQGIGRIPGSKAITTIKEALASGANEQPAQPEQEPEKEVTITCSCGDKFYIPLDELIKQLQEDKSQDFPRRFDTHAIPPQRTWVGLTDQEIRDWWRIENGLEDCNMAKLVDFTLAVRAIEAKLKDKNGY
jgi:hypothetical protein